MRTQGCDVSHWEGLIDWQQAARWIPFVYFKCTEGTGFLDNTFKHNKEGCETYGIPHAPYHYYQVEQEPVAQASWFISQAGDQFKRYILDIEDQTSLIPNLGASLLLFLNRCQQLTGVKPAIYTSAGFWNEFVMPKPEWAHEYDLLVAHYTIERTPILPIGWSHYVIWQYSDNFWFPGCSSYADGDWFIGNLEQARAWFGNYREVDPPVYNATRLRSHFDQLHIRKAPKISSTEVGHLSKGEIVDVEELGGADVWVKHARGWSAVERNDYRYMEVIKS